MDTEEKRELREQAHELAYQYIRHSGLYRELENAEWDALAEQWATWLLVGLEGRVNDEFTRIQAERDAVEAFAERAWSGNS